MDEVITYSLRAGKPVSDACYDQIAAFTDEVLSGAQKCCGYLLADFLRFVRESNPGDVRSQEEYALELLELGVLWNAYGPSAMRLSPISGKILAGLSELRQRGGLLKSVVDPLRGIMGTLFLKAESGQSTKHRIGCCKRLKSLLLWLNASGEFVQDCIRLKPWMDYLCRLPEKKAEEAFDAILQFACWFEKRSEVALGAYTLHVERFLRDQYLRHRWREDVVFCGRKRVEYHLNMVGAEIMNRAFRREFAASPRKSILLPACMRLRPEKLCRAVRTPVGYTCTGCTEGCRVKELTEMGHKHDFDVMIIPHESKAFSKYATRQMIGEDTGIVGIACVLNLMGGGWKAKGLGMPPQCVLLDYCGCSNHWHERGFATDINMKQLKKILGIDEKRNRQDESSGKTCSLYR